MTKEKIAAAVSLANEFIARARAHGEETAKFYESNGFKHYSSAPKESGALRRASMDLTRALSEMRRP